MKLKSRLKIILAELNMDNKVLAAKVGVSESTASLWVNGRSIPSLEKAYMVEEVTGRDIHQIWIREEEG